MAVADLKIVGCRKSESGFEIWNDVQKLTLTEGERGLILTNEVRNGDDWESLFDAGEPLIQGPHFDLYPSDGRMLGEENGRAALFLTGRRENPDYDWDVRIQAQEGSPWMRVRITCHLGQDLTLSEPEPTVALWMNRPDVEVSVDQGPVSLYGGHSWGNSFPAAYLWSEGKEAVFFFDPSPVTWMSPLGMRGFLDCRVATLSRDGRTGLGLHALSRSGDTLPATHMVVEYALYARARPERPTRLQGLGTMVEACAELLPAAAPFPENRVPPYETTWKAFTEGVIRDLMVKDVSWADLPSEWKDEPLFPEHGTTTFRLHSDYSICSSNTPELDRPSVTTVWDCATCNSFLAPWIAYARIHPDPEQEEFLQVKIENLPQFYDRKAKLFRWGAEGVALSRGVAATMANGIEMSWENFMFTLEPAKVYNLLPAERFNPALPGRVLMACEGLIELAHKVDYVFPQWFDAYHKVEINQLDIPALGKVREPFQVGTYAYLMLWAYDMCGDERYFEEARRSLRTVLERMSYKVVNRLYQTTYSDPVDFNIAETFGNGYAVAAAQRIYRITGDEAFRQCARDYFNILARMFFWYDDNSDAVARDLNNLGLFRPHGGHYGTCPWENIEAYLPLLELLRDADPPDPLLLKMFNLQRATAFYYFPPVWSDLVSAPNPRLYHHDCRYLPIENFYTLEAGGTHGSMGRCIYMCSIAFYNYLLYEALAETDDRSVMVLNLDVLENTELSLTGLRRHFIVFNPHSESREVVVCMKALRPGGYRVSVAGNDLAGHSHEELERGLTLHLDPMGHACVALEHIDAPALQDAIDLTRAAQGKLARAYQRLQERARDRGIDAAVSALKQRFLFAMDCYRSGDYAAARDAAAAITREVGSS